MSDSENKRILFDAGLCIGALLKGDLRYHEARSIVEAARVGELLFARIPLISLILFDIPLREQFLSRRF